MLAPVHAIQRNRPSLPRTRLVMGASPLRLSPARNVSSRPRVGLASSGWIMSQTDIVARSSGVHPRIACQDLFERKIRPFVGSVTASKSGEIVNQRSLSAFSRPSSSSWMRSSISATTDAQRSCSVSISSGVHSRGVESTTQNAPSVSPLCMVRGMPRYATTPRSSTAPLSFRNGCCVASPTTNGPASVTTYWQNECESGVCRRDAHGSARPCALLKNCRSLSTSETRETGAPSSFAARRVSRSNASSAGESSSPERRRTSSRLASSKEPGRLSISFYPSRAAACPGV